jgi:hypothetical protein
VQLRQQRTKAAASVENPPASYVETNLAGHLSGEIADAMHMPMLACIVCSGHRIVPARLTTNVVCAPYDTGREITSSSVRPYN